MQVDRQGFEVLGEQECLDLLQSRRLGRVGLVDRALPLIVPATFACHGGKVILGVAGGAIARAAASGQIVCFEADWVDEALPEAWSVSLVGPLVRLGQEVEPSAAAMIQSVPWTRHASEYVQIDPHIVSGRRFVAL